MTRLQNYLAGLLRSQNAASRVVQLPRQPDITDTPVMARKGQGEVTPKHDGPERRRWRRYRSDLAGFCRPITADRGVRWRFRLQNISKGGVSLLLDRPLRPGTTLALNLES